MSSFCPRWHAEYNMPAIKPMYIGSMLANLLGFFLKALSKYLPRETDVFSSKSCSLKHEMSGAWLSACAVRFQSSHSPTQRDTYASSWLSCRATWLYIYLVSSPRNNLRYTISLLDSVLQKSNAADRCGLVFLCTQNKDMLAHVRPSSWAKNTTGQCHVALALSQSQIYRRMWRGYGYVSSQCRWKPHFSILDLCISTPQFLCTK